MEYTMGATVPDMIKVPISAIQKQFWLINQMAPENSAYHVIDIFHLKGNLDLAALEKSVQTIIDRHEIFRTYLAFEKNTLFQCIVPETKFSPVFIDLLAEPEEKKPQRITSIIKHEKKKPFDLNKWPLIRLTVVHREPALFTIMFTIHHSIIDLASKALFASELQHLYAAYKADAEPPLTPPRYQYRDYVQWQQQWLESPQMEAQGRYWRNELKETDGFLQLPSDKKRPPLQNLEGAAHKIFLDPVLTKRLEQFNQENNVSVFLTLLAAYITLLYRYSGQKNIVVGVPLTNRREKMHKEIMGCFVNTMPLATTIKPEESFKQLLRQVRLNMLGAHRNQEIPLEEILTAVQHASNPSYNPLFQAGFTFAPPMPLCLPGMEIEPVCVHHGGSQLDIFATFWESNGGIEGFFEYNTALFESWRAKSLGDNYLTLLSSVLEKSDQPIDLLDIVSPAEKHKMLDSWNTTAINFEAPACLHHLIEQQVAAAPHNVAITFEEETLTYSELNQKANQLAFFLKNMGVGPGARVGVYLDRCAEIVPVLLAVFKAGAAYVPLDPDFPRERIAYMLDHSSAAVVLTKTTLESNLPDCKTNILCIDEQKEEIIRMPSENPAVKSSSDDLAYVIYTSGSTGKPKGVQIPHGAAVNFLLSMRRNPGIEKTDVLLAITTISFDISVLELFLPLAVGAKTVIASRTDASDGRLLSQALKAAGATIMQATPVTWRILFAAGWSAPPGFKALCGGEAMPPDLADNFVDNAGGVYNLYGPTETTVWSTCYHRTSKKSPISIGRPIHNTRIYLLDASMNPVPLGIPGELYIGGAGLAHGYLNAPELTENRFLPDPFSPLPGARLYKTGDWCRYLEDGNLEFCNRADNQVKVHGFRIELGEIEFMINQHPKVRESAAVVRENASGSKLLVGYVVSHDTPPSGESLRAFLLEKLPYYMVPSLFIAIEKMPLTPNAKIDRRALPQPGTERPELAESFIAPSNDAEKKMASIWRDLLSIDRIGIHDSFFLLGGNSMLSVQLAARIQEEFQCEIRVVKLFQYPTIHSLLNFLNKENDICVTDFSQRANLRKQAYKRRKSPQN